MFPFDDVIMQYIFICYGLIQMVNNFNHGSEVKCGEQGKIHKMVYPGIMYDAGVIIHRKMEWCDNIMNTTGFGAVLLTKKLTLQPKTFFM